jgi:hypothetical protein
MFPILIYDFSNGFKQTVIFLGWTIYKPFSFLIKHSSGNILSNFNQVLSFLELNLQKLIFQYNLIISVVIFLLSLFFLILKIKKKNNLKIENPALILLILVFISIFGVILNQTPSDAYLPIIFPLILLTVSIFFDYILNFKYLKYFAVLIITIIFITNFYYSYLLGFGKELKERVEATDKIIKLSGGNNYNLLGRGEGSQFQSFTMNYEYLLWWKGSEPSSKNEKIKIYISEDTNGIYVHKKP